MAFAKSVSIDLCYLFPSPRDDLTVIVINNFAFLCEDTFSKPRLKILAMSSDSGYKLEVTRYRPYWFKLNIGTASLEFRFEFGQSDVLIVLSKTSLLLWIFWLAGHESRFLNFSPDNLGPNFG